MHIFSIINPLQRIRGLRRTTLRRLVMGCGLVGCLWCLAGCQTPSYPPNSTLNVIDAAIPPVSATLREGDVIQITFATSTNLSTTQRIPLDGQLSLQFVGKVKATGLTPVELEDNLKKLYQSQLRGAEVITVSMISNAAAVYVAGAVLRPGKIPLDRPFTVLDAIMEAGGVDNTRAKLAGVTVLRVENGQRIARRVNLKRELEGKDPVLFYLKPYDIVYVPEKLLNF
jgi:polysaccharide export outer membrane protein